MNIAIAALYMVITALFSLNLMSIYSKFKEKKISAYSILATASLIVMFLALSIYFITSKLVLVLFAQIYLIGTMLYIKFGKKE